MELLDYLAWRNDVPLSLSPFNEVDNVIVRPAAHVSNRCKSGVRPVVGRT